MPSRRRFLSIAASVAAASALPGTVIASAPTPGAATAAAPTPGEAPVPVVWKGVAMGALASMTLIDPDRTRAQALIARCVDEIERLESIFSLYRADSALSRLNAGGELREPPLELVELMSFSLELARASEGAFDPTVQPLFELYAGHFAVPGTAPAGPSPRAIARVLKRVGFGAVDLRPDRIRLLLPGMAITLNGVAQGFVTDRVADLLRAQGMRHVLVDLGEARAVGDHGDGRPWRAAVADPAQPSRSLFELSLADGPGGHPALATSGGYGTRFGPDPRVHHLFDPHSGRSANHHASVSVAAPRATVADGLATALSIVRPARAAPLLAGWPAARAWFVDDTGRIRVEGAVEQLG